MELFPSTLIIAKNKDAINAKIEEICLKLNHKFDTNNPDLFLINQDSGWGIEEIRKINNFLSQKPFSHQSKIVVIFESQNLNIESQNALLKNLEEPGLNNYLILCTNNIKSIIPTIISRSFAINIVDQAAMVASKIIEISTNIVKDLTLSEKLAKDKEDVLPLLENQLRFYQQELVKNPSKKTSYLIEKIIKAITMINSNVDPKSALDYVFLA